MKILLCSHLFAPGIGGTETVGALLAAEFVRAGHDVQVVTPSPGPPAAADAPYPIHRRPPAGTLLRLLRECDVCFHNGLSLRAAWPLLGIRRPWVVVHHTWLTRTDGSRGWQDRLKRRVLRHARQIAVSRALAAALPGPAEVIPNPYRHDLFRELPGVPRDRDLMFLGRLVSDKGADLLLAALALLRPRGLRPGLTLTGDGPERAALQAEVARLGLGAQVEFTGALVGPALVERLNRHRVLVVPSRWAEPFGVVVLEGVACGCAVVGSAQGGLPEAIGPCGATFPNGDAAALAARLEEVLGSPALPRAWRAAAPAHLAAHHPAAVAQRYLQVFESARAR